MVSAALGHGDASPGAGNWELGSCLVCAGERGTSRLCAPILLRWPALALSCLALSGLTLFDQAEHLSWGSQELATPRHYPPKSPGGGDTEGTWRNAWQINSWLMCSGEAWLWPGQGEALPWVLQAAGLSLGRPDPNGIRRKAAAAVRDAPQAQGDATCEGRWMVSGCARQGSEGGSDTPVVHVWGHLHVGLDPGAPLGASAHVLLLGPSSLPLLCCSLTHLHQPPPETSWFPVQGAPSLVDRRAGLSLSPSSTPSDSQRDPWDDSRENANLSPGHLHGLAAG